MSFQSAWQVSQSDTSQVITETPLQDFTYSGNYPCYGSCNLRPCLPEEQCSQLPVDAMCSPVGTSSLPTNSWGWSGQNDPLNLQAMVPDSSLLQIQPAAEDQNVLVQPSSEEQDLKLAVSGLQHRTEKLEELFGNFQTEFMNVLNDFRYLHNDFRALQNDFKKLQNDFRKLQNDFSNLQNELEEEKARFCSEIDASVEKLKGWTAELKRTVDSVAGELKDTTKSK